MQDLKYQLKDKNWGKWHWKHPESGVKFGPFPNFNDLERAISRYDAANGFEPVEMLRAQVENFMCLDPAMERRCVPCGKHRKRKWNEYVSGGKVYLKRKFMGDAGWVGAETAEKRASICAGCPYNSNLTGRNPLQEATDNLAEAEVAEKKTSFDEKLKFCIKCSCPNKYSVHVAQRLIQEETPPAIRITLPANALNMQGERFTCWKLVEV